MKIFEKVEEQYDSFGQMIFGFLLVACGVSALAMWTILFVHWPIIGGITPFAFLAAFLAHMRLTGGKK